MLLIVAHQPALHRLTVGRIVWVGCSYGLAALGLRKAMQDQSRLVPATVAMNAGWFFPVASGPEANSLL